LAALAEVGRLLGVRLDGRLVLDAAPRAHGATGLVRGGRIHLDPERWDPASPAGRHVLAHEAVHLLQHRAAEARTVEQLGGNAGLRAAEAEADALADALVAGRAPWTVTVGLAGTAVVLDVGAERLGDAEVRASHASLVNFLEAAVFEGYPDSWQMDAALERLDAEPIDVGAGAVHALPRAARVELVAHLDVADRRGRRHAVLAVQLGLDADQLAALGADDLATVDLVALDAAEQRAAVAILRALDHDVLAELMRDGAPNAASVNRLVEEPLPGAPTGEPDTPAGIVALVREDVRDVSRAGSLRALDRLARLLTPAPGSAPAGSAQPPIPAAGTAAAPAGDELDRDPRGRLREAIGAMARDGTLGRLLEGVGETHDGLSDDQRRLLEAISQLRGPVADDVEGGEIAARARDKLSRDLTDWVVSDADATAALPDVLRLARHHPRLLRRLDADGAVDTLFDELPEDLLYRADVRGQTGEIMAARNGEVLFEGARRKLSRGPFGLSVHGLGTVTARDAYLASRMVEALSPGQQQAFAELAGGELMTRMNDELTASMRAAPDRHGLSPAAAATHREQLQTQLSDPGTWTDAHVETLRTLVVMATAMGLAAWVFDRSKAYHDPGQDEVRRRVVTPHRLYDPEVGRTTWVPDTVEGTGFFSEGIFADLEWFGDLVGVLFENDTFRVDEDDTGTRISIGLEQASDLLGGDLQGALVRTAEDDARRRAEQVAAGDTTRPPRLPDTNVVTLRHDHPGDDGRGLLSLHAPALDLASYRSVGDSSVMAFGGLRAAPLDASLAYTSGERLRPTWLQVSVGDLAIDDLVVASGESIAGASRFGASGLKLSGGTAQIPDAVGGASGNASGFLHWLWPFVDEALALLPLVSSWEAQASALSALEVAFGNLTIDGLIVAGQRVERVTGAGLHVGYGSDRLSYLRVLRRSLERRLQRSEPGLGAYALRRRLQRVDTEIEARAVGEDERQELEDRFQRAPAAMTTAERARLRELRGTGGAVIDAASLTLQGVAGTTELEGELTLEGISGEAAFPGRVPGMATAAARAQEFADVGPPGLHDLDRPHVRLHVDRARFGALTVPGDLPTADALREQVADLDSQLSATGAEQDPGLAAVAERRAALQHALETDLPRYQVLEDRAAATAWRPGGPDPQNTQVPLTVAEERERAGLRASLRLLDAMRVRSGEIEDLEVGADLAGTVTTVAARAAQLQGIERGGREIEQLTGRDLSATITSDRVGTEGRTGLPDTLASVELGAGRLAATGIRQDGVQLAEEVHLTGVLADVRRTEDGWNVASLEVATLSLSGFRLVGGGRVLTSFPDDPALAGGAPGTGSAPAGGGTIELQNIQAAGSLTLDERGAPVSATVRGLVIGALRASDPIRYQDETRDLTLRAEAITNIVATGLVLPLTDDTVPLPTAGTVSIGGLDRVAAAGRFTAALEAALGLDGTPPSGTTLEVTFTPEGIEVGRFDLPLLRVEGLVFDDGTRYVEIAGPAVLRGITGRASVGLPRSPDPQTGEPGFNVGAITVAELDVAEISAPDLLYADGTRYLEAEREYQDDEIFVSGLHVRGWVLDAAGVFQGASVDVDYAQVGLVGWFASNAIGGIEAEVEGLYLDIGAGLREVSGSVGAVDFRGGGVMDGSVVGGEVEGLGVGAFGWDGQTLRIGDAEGAGGLTIEYLMLDEVTFASEKLELEVGATGSGAVSLSGVEAAATVTFQRDEAGKVDYGLFSAQLGHVHADELAAEGMTVRFPEYGVELAFPPGLVATASSLHLVPNDGEPLLVERLPSAAGPAMNVQGRLEAGLAVVPRLELAVGERLTSQTRLELDGLGIGRLGSGELQLDAQRLDALGTHVAADLRALGLGVIDPDAPESPGLDLQALLDAAHAALSPWSAVLDHANGHVRATMSRPGWPWWEQLDLVITDGQMDLRRLENAFGYLVDWTVLDFEFFAGRWVVLQLGDVPILSWDLDTGEQEVADGTRLPLRQVFDAWVPPSTDEAVRAASAGAPSTDPLVQLEDVHLALDVLNPVAIPVSVPPVKGGRLERFDTVIPPGALLGLRASGNIPGPAGTLRLDLARLRFGRTDIRLADVKGGTLEAGAKEFEVAGAGADLAFEGGTGGVGGSPNPPTGAEGDIQSLKAAGVQVRWIPGAGP